MEFNFGEVERTLALAYNIADDKRTAFAARLKHLQKRGFPPGINTGRGRAAVYNVGHLVLLGVALELNQLGLTPERAIKAIGEDLHAVAMAVHMAARSDEPRNGSFEFPMFLYCDPAVLGELTNDDAGGYADWASATFFYAGIGQALESFQDWFKAGVRRMAFFSVSALLWELASHVPKDGDQTIRDFYKEVLAWADPFIHNVDYSINRSDQPYWNTIDRTDLANGNDPKA